jgi:hypothetical protein
MRAAGGRPAAPGGLDACEPTGPPAQSQRQTARIIAAELNCSPKWFFLSLASDTHSWALPSVRAHGIETAKARAVKLGIPLPSGDGEIMCSSVPRTQLHRASRRRPQPTLERSRRRSAEWRIDAPPVLQGLP